MTQLEQRLFPLFRYHPFPVYTGTIELKTITCAVCGQTSDFRYVLPDREDDHAGAEIPHIEVCPWCLHDGSVARRYPTIWFNDPQTASGIGELARDELAHRTPAYAPFQEAHWPMHHNDYCAFIGYAGWKEVVAYAAELASDLTRLRRQLGWRKAELEAWRSGSSVQGYLFRCTTCGTHRLLFDLE